MHTKKVQVVVVVVLSSLLAWYRECDVFVLPPQFINIKGKLRMTFGVPIQVGEWAVCVSLNLGSYFLAFWKSRYFRSYSTHCM